MLRHSPNHWTQRLPNDDDDDDDDDDDGDKQAYRYYGIMLDVFNGRYKYR